MSSSRRQYCAVDGCRNQRTVQGLSFFKLPSDEERRHEWLRLIGRPDLMDRCYLKFRSYIVCSLHFDDDMIITRPQLRAEARPTRHLPTPAPRGLPDTAEACCQTVLSYLGTPRKKKKTHKSDKRKTDTQKPDTETVTNNIHAHKTDTQKANGQNINMQRLDTENTVTQIFDTQKTDVQKPITQLKQIRITKVESQYRSPNVRNPVDNENARMEKVAEENDCGFVVEVYGRGSRR